MKQALNELLSTWLRLRLTPRGVIDFRINQVSLNLGLRP
jgi:hypothetical protein